MGHWVTLRLLVLLSTIFLSHGKSIRRHDIAYVADPVGNILLRPDQTPTRVGSPASLARPDRYEFYTFDETGELIKRLMTLEEIQQIIATGEGDDGHLLTISQADLTKPSSPLNYQAPSHIKVHTIVNNVQNVLKAEMEAQKTNRDKPTIFDTPDVSSSWSMILPAIFGNTGGSITPDTLLSSHIEPETDVISESSSVEKESDDHVLPEKETSYEQIDDSSEEKDSSESDSFTTTVKPSQLKLETKTTDVFELLSTRNNVTPEPEKSETVGIQKHDYKNPITTTTTIRTTTSTKPKTTTTTTTTTTVPTTIKIIQTTQKEILTTKPVTQATEKSTVATTKAPTTKKVVINNVLQTTTEQIMKSTQKQQNKPTLAPIRVTNKVAEALIATTTTKKPTTTIKYEIKNTTIEQIIPNKVETVTTSKPTIPISTTSVKVDQKIQSTTPIIYTTSQYPQLDLGEIINKIAVDLQNSEISTSQIYEDNTPSIPSKVVSTTTTTEKATVSTTTEKATVSTTKKEKAVVSTTSNPTVTTKGTTEKISTAAKIKTTTEKTTTENGFTFVKIIPILRNTTKNYENKTTPTRQSFIEFVQLNDDYLDLTTPVSAEYIDVTKPEFEDLNDSITDLISQIVADDKATLIPITELSRLTSETQTLLPEEVTTVLPLETRKATEEIELQTTPTTRTSIKLSNENKSSLIEKPSTTEDIIPTTYRPTQSFIRSTKSPATTMKTDQFIPVTIINQHAQTKDNLASSSSKIESTTVSITTPTTSTTTTSKPTQSEAIKEEPSTTLSDESIALTTILPLEDYEHFTTDIGSTEDHELMDMLNQVSQIFQISPQAEAKSDDDIEDEEDDRLTTIKPDDVVIQSIQSVDKNAKKEEGQNESKTTKKPAIENIKNNITSESIKKVQTISSTTPKIDSTEKAQQISNTTPKIETKIEKHTEKAKIQDPLIANHSIVVVNDKKSNVSLESVTSTIKPNEKVTQINLIKIETIVSSTTTPKIDVVVENVTTIDVKEESTVSPSINVTQAPSTTTVKAPVTEKLKENLKNTNITSKSTGITVPPSPQTKAADSASSFDRNKVNKNDFKLENQGDNTWKLVSTVVKSNDSKSHTSINVANKKPPNTLHSLDNNLDNNPQGLEVTAAALGSDVSEFAQLCNELAFKYWNSVSSNGPDAKRSLVVSPFAVTSLLAMMFLGARGATSGEMNDILKLDDMVTFNPHIIFKNVTESIEVSKKTGVATSAFVRELYSDRSKGRLLSFYKDRVQQFYNGHVEEINFNVIGDIVRRRTNLLVKRQTWGKIPEYIKGNNMVMRAPLSVFAANIFQTDCTAASTDGRDGEMYFVVSPTIRQRRLVPVPAVLYKAGFLAGYVPELDATVAALGGSDQIVSTILVMPGQQGSTAQGDHILDLQERIVKSAIVDGTWSKLLKSLLPRPGLELQIPRFSHRSVENAASSLQKMGLKDLFTPEKADLRGLNGVANDLYVSDMMLVNTFTTCGEGMIGEQHHTETYPGEPNKAQRRLWRTQRPVIQEVIDSPIVRDLWEEPQDYQRAFHDPLYDNSYLSMPLHLRPRQARLPESQEQPRLKFDRPFMFFVRHNPTGLILYMGRYNPRLLP